MLDIQVQNSRKPYVRVTEEVMSECARQIRKSFDRFGHRLPHYTELPPVTLDFSVRGTAAGYADTLYADERCSVTRCRKPRTLKIKLNSALLMDKKTRKEMVEQTIPHEVAHLITHILWNKGGHGSHWRWAMYELGLDPDVYHKMKTSNTGGWKMKRWVYECKCRTHNITSIRHNKAQKGRARYHCQVCGHTIKWTGKQA